MENNIQLWLSDIKRSLIEIYQFLPVERTFEAFQKDLKTRKAVERNLEIIGEALNRIVKVNPEIKITNTRRSSIPATGSFTVTILFRKILFGPL